MIEVIKYKTSDGKEFSLKEDALAHEKKQKVLENLKEFFENNDLTYHDYNLVYNLISEYFEEFKEIINK